MKNSNLIHDLIVFLDSSPTAWHAVENAKNQLLAANFISLSESQAWDIQPEQAYMITRNGSSLCAFITPKHFPKRLRLLASHTDSPALKLKPQPEIRKHQTILLGVEVYGAPLLSSWLNRDLGIAGRILYQDETGKFKESLVQLDSYPVVIPQLAIHLDRDVNEKGLLLNKQEHLNALAGLESSFDRHASQVPFLESILSEKIDFKQLISHDLMLYPLEKSRLSGYKNSLLSAYRIDSLASVHACLTALLNDATPLNDEIKMVLFWDNEEIGSQTAQGANSPFFTQILERIVAAFKGSREDYFCAINRSTCISVDLAHALHPNHAEKHDPNHQPILGQGVVLKSNAQQRYATSARSALPIHAIASLKAIPLQTFTSRNDIPCGTTIGPLQAVQTGMPTVDIGCAQLSMHSCRELMSVQDHIDMCHLLSELLQSPHWPEVGDGSPTQ